MSGVPGSAVSMLAMLAPASLTPAFVRTTRCRRDPVWTRLATKRHQSDDRTVPLYCWAPGAFAAAGLYRAIPTACHRPITVNSVASSHISQVAQPNWKARLTHNVTAYIWRDLFRQLTASCMNIPTGAAVLTELVELVLDMLAEGGTPDLRSPQLIIVSHQ